MELTRKVKIAIIENHITRYEQDAYSVTLEAKVAKSLDDDPMYQVAATNLKRIEQAQDTLRRELAQVQGEAEGEARED